MGSRDFGLDIACAISACLTLAKADHMDKSKISGVKNATSIRRGYIREEFKYFKHNTFNPRW